MSEKRVLNARRNRVLIAKQTENASLKYTVIWGPEIQPDTISSSTWTSENLGLTFVTQDTGTHTGAADAAILTDSAATFLADDLIGATVSNTTDSSTATITDNAATTVTGTLSGGTDDDWDNADAYTINYFTDTKAWALISGAVGRYRVVNKITTASGETDERYIDLIIEDNDSESLRDYQ